VIQIRVYTYEMEKVLTGKCVYILKTGKNIYKIGKTQDLQKRLFTYQTHLPIMFRVVRQYPASNINELEEGLHVVFQHKRVKGEWFELTQNDLIICDNIANSFALTKMQRQGKKYRQIEYQGNPLLQVMESNEKYLSSYSKVAEDIRLGLSTNEIIELYEGTISKVVVETVRRLLKLHTPNSEFISQWIFIVNDLEAGLNESQIVEKYKGQISRTTVQMIKRILKNQLY
jgi:hypothetical protein